MQSVVAVFQFVVAHFAEIVAAVVALLVALIGIFALIPGNEPEATLQKIVDFIKKFSVKP